MRTIRIRLLISILLSNLLIAQNPAPLTRTGRQSVHIKATRVRSHGTFELNTGAYICSFDALRVSPDYYDIVYSGSTNDYHILWFSGADSSKDQAEYLAVRKSEYTPELEKPLSDADGEFPFHSDLRPPNSIVVDQPFPSGHSSILPFVGAKALGANNESYWIPETSRISTMEGDINRLSFFLKRIAQFQLKYLYFQYYGTKINGRLVIYIHAFPMFAGINNESEYSNWRNQAACIDDHRFAWSAIYDPERRSFSNIRTRAQF